MAHHRLASSLFALAGLAVLVILAGCGGGGGGSDALLVGQITGRIYFGATAGMLTATPTRTDSRPVDGATVRVQGTTLSTTTAVDGSFTLDNVPAGPQLLVISYNGFQSVAISVTVQANTTVDAADGVLQTAPRKWTVLIYLNADNDLEADGVADVNEMERAPLPDDVTVAVQMDRSPLSDASQGYDSSNGDWSDTRRFTIVHDNDTQLMSSARPASEGGSPYFADLGELDMGNPQTLQDFLQWGQSTLPAEHYLVLLWNHGNGWKSRAATAPQVRGISYDETSGNTYLRTVDLPVALRAPAPLDIVAYDACRMQMLEIAYELRDTCQYVVGSEEDVPAPGFDYSAWLTPLASNPAMSPLALADTMASSLLATYGSYSNVTNSVIDTSRLEDLVGALDAFSTALSGAANTYADKLADARDQAESYADRSYKDLGDYAAQVKAKTGDALLGQRASAVMAALGRAVPKAYNGSYHQRSTGVSIYLPKPGTYDFTENMPYYTGLAFAKRTHWDEWLNAQKK